MDVWCVVPRVPRVPRGMGQYIRPWMGRAGRNEDEGSVQVPRGVGGKGVMKMKY